MRIQAPRNRSPAQNWGRRPGCPTDDDVLRRRPFEIGRINPRITHQGGQGQNSRQAIDLRDQDGHRGDTQNRCEDEALRHTHGTGR